jgi:hypothetical protein
MYKYQNVTTYPLSIPGLGQVEPQGIIITDSVIENPNFKYLGEASEEAEAVPAETLPAVAQTQEINQ